MRADADEIEAALSAEELVARQAETDLSECHRVVVQAYWGYYPVLTRLKTEGEHLRLRALADEIERGSTCSTR